MWRTQRLSLGVSWLLQSGHNTYWMNSRLWLLWMLLKILIAEKIFEYPFSSFFNMWPFFGEQCAQKTPGGHIRQIRSLLSWGSRWHQAVVLILWILVKTNSRGEIVSTIGKTAPNKHGWDHHKHVQWSKAYRGLWRKNWAMKTRNAAWKQMWSSGIYYIYVILYVRIITVKSIPL